jgi:hypothetical protein
MKTIRNLILTAVVASATMSPPCVMGQSAFRPTPVSPAIDLGTPSYLAQILTNNGSILVLADSAQRVIPSITQPTLSDGGIVTVVLRAWYGPSGGAAQVLTVTPPPEVQAEILKFDYMAQNSFATPVQETKVSPVPEPSSLSLLALAAASAFVFKRRFRPVTR